VRVRLFIAQERLTSRPALDAQHQLYLPTSLGGMLITGIPTAPCAPQKSKGGEEDPRNRTLGLRQQRESLRRNATIPVHLPARALCCVTSLLGCSVATQKLWCVKVGICFPVFFQLLTGPGFLLHCGNPNTLQLHLKASLISPREGSGVATFAGHRPYHLSGSLLSRSSSAMAITRSPIKSAGEREQSCARWLARCGSSYRPW
jgi:hypothetical protein